MKQILITCFSLVLLFSGFYGYSQGFQPKSAEQYFKQLPNNPAISYFEDSLLQIIKTARELPPTLIKETGENGATFYIHETEQNQNLTIRVMHADQNQIILSCLGSVMESWIFTILKWDGNSWKDATKELMPAEYQELIKDYIRIFPNISSTKLNFDDMDVEQTVTFIWNKNKYQLLGSIPKKFGRSLE